MLSQSEADALIAMHKQFTSRSPISVQAGIGEIRELIGADLSERFLLDIWRGTIKLSKLRYQTRARHVVVLVRLDIDGAPHTNPDGERLPGTHMHLYREGYEDKWAFSVDPASFIDLGSVQRSLEDFCVYCNIRDLPDFQSDLL